MTGVKAAPSLKRPADMSELDEMPKRPRLRVPYQRHPKPPYTYMAIIAVAIHRSRNQRLTLPGVQDMMEEMFDFFKGEYRGWRDSVRHNLSHNDCFSRIQRNSKNSKGCYWTVNLSLIPARSFKRIPTKDTDRWAPDIFQQLNIPDFSLSNVEVTKAPKRKQQPKIKEEPRPSFSIDNILGQDKLVPVGEPVDTKYDHPYSFLAYHSLPPVQYGDLVFAPGSSDQQTSFCPPGRYDDIDSMSLKDYYMQRDVPAANLTISSQQQYASVDQSIGPQQMYCSQEASNTPQQPQFFRPFQADSCSYTTSNIINHNTTQSSSSYPAYPDTLTATYHQYPSHAHKPAYSSDFTNPQQAVQDPQATLRQHAWYPYSSNPSHDFISISHDNFNNTSQRNFNSIRSTDYPISQHPYNYSGMPSGHMNYYYPCQSTTDFYHQAFKSESADIANAMNASNHYDITPASNYPSTATICSTASSMITEVDDTELFSDTSSHHVLIPILSDSHAIFHDIDTVFSSSNSTPEDESAHRFDMVLPSS